MKTIPTASARTGPDEPSQTALGNAEVDLTSQAESDAGSGAPPESSDFSLVLGGAMFQLWRRAHLSGDSLEFVHRRVLVITMLAWLPLLILSAFQSHAVGGAIKIPLLHDIEANVRFLVALPVLIIAELVVQERISPLIRRFVERRIVVAEDLPAFEAAVRSAHRVRDSKTVELTLLFLVYTAGLWIWRSQLALADPTWYASPVAKQLHLSFAGYWYVFVSIPIFQFILMRWYMRIAIWFRLLWQISRLSLHLNAAHPDQAGGIGFLGKGSYAFGPILFAEGVLLSGLIASRVLHEGRPLMSFKTEAAGFVGFFVLVILGPLVMYAPQLELAKRKATATYGLMASRYLLQFEEKGLTGGASATNDLFATQDFRPVSEVRNRYSAVRQMRLVPFGSRDIIRLAIATAAPLLPLTLMIFSVAEVAKFLLKTVIR